MPTTIRSIRARQVLDSRGRPTVEVDVLLTNGTLGRASVPSGASTGASEAHELRDGDLSFFGGLGVKNAVSNVNGEIADAMRGIGVADQRALDMQLIELDGTTQLKRLGANAVLGVSLAACRAAAAVRGKPLYRHIAELAGNSRLAMPMPMINILSGGLHAGRGMDVQDFLAIPANAKSMHEAIELASRLRNAASIVAAKHGITTLLADEGGISPGCTTGRKALELMIQTIEAADSARRGRANCN